MGAAIEDAMAAKKKPTKDPKGGLTAAGRKELRRREGSHLRPGVRGPADTPEKLRRKGSFLRRMFAHDRGALVDEHGKPTRRALSAHAWGEPVPRTRAAAKKLAAKGSRLLERYKKSKADAEAAKKPSKRSGQRRRASSLVENINRRKQLGTSRPKSKSTVSKKAYADMRAGWPKSRAKKATSAKRARAAA